MKSTYRYAMETLNDNEEFCISGYWNRLSDLKIPQRVVSFVENY